jgi:Fic family protein
MNRLSKRLDDLPLSTINLLSQIDQLNGQWIGGAQLSLQVLGRLKRSVLVTSTGASTRIEGADLSDEEVEKLMRGLSTQKLTDRDAQEVQGYYETLAAVFESWKDIDLTENSIKHLHSQLLKYSYKDERQRGEYKKLENKVVATDHTGNAVGTIFDTTPAYLTPKEVSELITWTQEALNAKTYHPLLVIANFVVEFLKIHPFLDGNGRLSRILTNLLMLQAGYEYIPYVSHEKLVEDNKTDYYIALRKSQITFKTSEESILAWADFFLRISYAQAEQATGLMSNEILDKLLSPNQLLVWNYIQNVEESSVQDITQATDVARPTVRQAIERLLALKKIERIGLGRTTRYRKL